MSQSDLSEFAGVVPLAGHAVATGPAAPAAGGRASPPSPDDDAGTSPDGTTEAAGEDGDGEAAPPGGGRGGDGPPGPARPAIPQDFPPARSLKERIAFTWDEDKAAVDNYDALGAALAQAGDLYRDPGYGGGLVFAAALPNVPPEPIRDPAPLQAIVVDRLVVDVIKDGKPKGGAIPAVHLRTMLRSEAFLQRFRPVDEVIDRPMYLAPDFRVTVPGYNDGGPGQRVLHVGGRATVADGLDATGRFLDVMAFETPSDRANAIAAALTVLLRNHWPGGKPIVVITSTKSHGGKETLVGFAAGLTPMIAISYTETDWALERSYVGACRQDPRIGLVNVDNARLGRDRHIRSAFLERYLTDPAPFLFSTGTGRPVRRPNTVVVTMTTNFGLISEDLMNRSLPIRLAPTGDVTSRRSPIGNPKLEYLPANRERIEAELRGLIDRWVVQGRPLDESLHHPFTAWARTVGGILMANGLTGFLGNLDTRRTTDDPVRRGLGLLGAADPDEWRTSQQWAAKAAGLGLVKALVPEADRGSEAGRARGMGVVLSAHRDETFEVETDDHRLRLRLQKQRKRFEPGDEPSTRYQFRIVEKVAIPADEGQAG